MDNRTTDKGGPDKGGGGNWTRKSHKANWLFLIHKNNSRGSLCEVKEVTQKSWISPTNSYGKPLSRKNLKQKSIEAKSLAVIPKGKKMSRIIPPQERHAQRTNINYNFLFQKQVKYIKKMMQEMKCKH